MVTRVTCQILNDCFPNWDNYYNFLDGMKETASSGLGQFTITFPVYRSSGTTEVIGKAMQYIHTHYYHQSYTLEIQYTGDGDRMQLLVVVTFNGGEEE
jgi:hypothetical protein